MRSYVVMLGVLLLSGAAPSHQALQDAEVAVIYFVRHAEVPAT